MLLSLVDEDDFTINRLAVTKQKGELRAYREGIMGQEITDYNEEQMYRQSPPLKSLDEAIELLLLFRNDREKLNSMVLEWDLMEEE